MQSFVSDLKNGLGKSAQNKALHFGFYYPRT